MNRRMTQITAEKFLVSPRIHIQLLEFQASIGPGRLKSLVLVGVFTKARFNEMKCRHLSKRQLLYFNIRTSTVTVQHCNGKLAYSDVLKLLIKGDLFKKVLDAY